MMVNELVKERWAEGAMGDMIARGFLRPCERDELRALSRRGVLASPPAESLAAMVASMLKLGPLLRDKLLEIARSA